MKKQISQLHDSILSLKNDLEELRKEFMASLQMNEMLMMMLLPEEILEEQNQPEYARVPAGAFYDPCYSPSRLP